jgi:predicted RNase H-like HicB family nuclease
MWYNICERRSAMARTQLEYIVLTFLVEQEGPFYVSKCLELGVASFGDDEKEAYENLADAVEVYLNTLEDLGTARQVLKDKGVAVYAYEPATLEVSHARFPVGSFIRPHVLTLEGAWA